MPLLLGSFCVGEQAKPLFPFPLFLSFLHRACSLHPSAPPIAILPHGSPVTTLPPLESPILSKGGSQVPAPYLHSPDPPSLPSSKVGSQCPTYTKLHYLSGEIQCHTPPAVINRYHPVSPFTTAEPVLVYVVQSDFFLFLQLHR